MAVAWFATVAAWRTTNDLRLYMTRHVLTLDHEFHRTHTPGELIQRVDGDVSSVSDFLGQVVPRALGATFLVVGMNLVLVVVDWRLAIGMTVFLIAALGVVVATRHRRSTRPPARWASTPRSTAGSRNASRRPRTCGPTAPPPTRSSGSCSRARGAAQLGRTRAGVPVDVVGRPGFGHRRLGALARRECRAGAAWHHLARHGVPAVPVRARRVPTARRRRAPARDRPEGERRHAPGGCADGRRARLVDRAPPSPPPGPLAISVRGVAVRLRRRPGRARATSTSRSLPAVRSA